MKSYNEIEAIKEFEQCSLIGNLAIKVNKGKRVIIKESKKNNFLFGEIECNGKNKNFYCINLPSGENVKLFYSNLEKVFINNKRA
ncbi:unnamed protein product [marine sediment metagenome]|uniref:Uncharacterized protein n=1 Tax=marine sediment metagenome TaxID=412755 RepID=X1MN86_9ZZZZ